MSDQNLKKIKARLDRLEKAVFGGKRKGPSKPKARGRKGPAQGIRLLISEGFLTSKKRLAEVRTALSKKDYHYSTQVIDTALRRLGKRRGPLVVLKEGGQNVYVGRR